MKADGEMYSGTVTEIRKDGFEVDLGEAGPVWVDDEPSLVKIGSDVTLYVTGDCDEDGDQVVLFVISDERTVH